MARKKDKRDISTLNNELNELKRKKEKIQQDINEKQEELFSRILEEYGIKDISELELLLKEKINYNNNKNTGNEISE
ncbi:MAG: hypothetical protein HFH59_17305 [Lachnospiraceae bacterium]|jgi:uncharacterized protein YoxC|nr:hypothetical protein [Lachnospiraceae bacterium]